MRDVIDVVLCGNIRSELSFFQICREIVVARKNGLVGQVVFATWNSEGVRFPTLFATLNQAGIDVVTMAPPNPYSGSLVIQQLQFWRGLQALDQQSGWVMRTRTDKSFAQTIALFHALRLGHLPLASMPLPSQIFSKRIVVDGVAVSEAFPHNDLTFIVDKDDARRVLNFDASFDYVLNDVGYFSQEARWFVAPIMAAHPALKQFWEHVNSYRLGIAIEKAAIQGTLADAPDDLFRHLGSYWSVAHDCFALPDNHDHAGLPLTIEALSGAKQRPWTIRWGSRVLATSQRWLEHLAHGDPGPDEILGRAAIFRITPSNYNESLRNLDFDALNYFIDSQDVPKTELPERSVIQRARISPEADFKAIFDSLVRTETARSLQDETYDILEAATEIDRNEGGSQTAFLNAGRQLASDARAQNDRGRAEMAFLFLVSAALARNSDAMELLCGLAYSGLLGTVQAHEAYDTAYYFFVAQPDNGAARYWHGMKHIQYAAGRVDQIEFGEQCIREAIERGYDPGDK